MVLQPKIPKQQENAVASYDYVDIVNGFGNEIFYLLDRDDDTNGTTYHLVEDQSESGVIKQATQTTDPHEFNFDTSIFQSSRTVKGTASFNTWIEASSGPDSGSKITVTIYRVDENNTEYQIGSEEHTTGTITSPPTSTTSSVNIPITLTETTIKQGEKLRLSVIMDPGDPTTDHAIGTDPTNKDSAVITPSSTTNATTVSQLKIPFKIYT